MANEYGLFWNSDNYDRPYNADSFAEWLLPFFTTGVFQDNLQVTAGTGMKVLVGTGYANINGKVRNFDTATEKTIPTAGANPRIDTIVVERNDTNRMITIEYVQGAYNGNSPVPKAPVRTGGVYQIVLAQIYVAAGATTITQSDITDKRPDADVCGWVTGTIEEIDLDQILAQSTAQFNAWFDAMKGQLTTDAAGHLQTEIDELDGRLDDVEADIAVTEIAVTLAAASWSSLDDTYTITNAAIDPSKEIILTYDPAMLDGPYEALQDAGIRPYGAVTSGSMTVKATGGAPDSDISIILLIRG